MRLTVAGEMASCWAICSPVWRCRRKASTAAQVAGGVWPGDESGREERSRRAVAKTLDALIAETFDPLGDRLRRGVVAARDLGLAQSTIHHAAYHALSTFRSQASILVAVHSVLRESLRFGNVSVPGQGRMDNLLKVHI